MIVRPSSIDELRAVVTGHPRLRVRGSGTKSGLSSPAAGETTLDLSGLAGVTEHVPDECTFTALAGTRLADIEPVLAAHGQYLPFDPPLVAAGATLGGTVAAGVSGSCRYRYGGIRDFLIGARVVDGRGGLIRCGGKVVKNAAGFLLHQGMVGSCGRFGVLADLTFKVFPRPAARATIVAAPADLDAALGSMASVLRTRFDVEALDIDRSSSLCVRVSGFAGGLPSRIAAVRGAIGGASEVLHDEADDGLWRDAREFAWAPRDWTLARVPLTIPRIPEIERLVAGAGALRRYALGGNVALVAWPGSLGDLSEGLAALGLVGQVLIGRSDRPFIGAFMVNAFERRVRSVMDPDGRFAAD